MLLSKIIYIMLLSFIPLFSFAQPITTSSVKVVKVQFAPDYAPDSISPDTIYFDPRHPLQWSDYTAKRSSVKYMATTFSSFGYTGNANQKNDTLYVCLTLQVFFVKDESFASPEAYGSNYSLAHEQLHFDITRIAAEKFKQAVLNTPMKPDDYDSYIPYLYLTSFQEMNHLQDQYDNETQHGRDRAAQQKWAEYVAGQLDIIYRKK